MPHHPFSIRSTHKKSFTTMPHRILKVAEHGMLDAYDATLKARGFKSDPAQRAAAQRLQGLYSELVSFKAARRGTIRKLLSRPKQPRSVYFWGGVGRGKSFLMDCFYDSVPGAFPRLHAGSAE